MLWLRHCLEKLMIRTKESLGIALMSLMVLMTQELPVDEMMTQKPSDDHECRAYPRAPPRLLKPSQRKLLRH